MNPQLPQNEIRKHIYSIPPLLLAESENMLKKVPKILSGLAGEHIQSILFTGCGYSYAACLAIKQAFQRITKLPVQVLPAIDVSRFTDLGNPGLSSTLLIATSYSGEVSRINEALALYQKHGALTIGITGNPASKMREYCRFLIPASAPPLEKALPLRGFVMTYLALLSIGCTLAKMGKPAFSVSEITSEIMRCAEDLETALPYMDEETYAFTTHVRKAAAFEFIGAGYERGAAFLGKIEMMGQAGAIAVDEDPEQWLHCNFFMAGPENIGTILFLASGSPALSRGEEALTYLLHLGRPACVVTDSTGYTGPAMAVHVPRLSDVTAGLVEMAVPSLLTGYICEMRGETYSRGFRDQWAIFRDGRGTTKSKITVL